MKKSQVVETQTGKLQGLIEDGIGIFKAIPYAEEPIGDLRFLPTVPLSSWNGILEAFKFGPHAIQLPPLPGSILPQIDVPKSEKDCLKLNIWTPNVNSDNLPVLVWIHGGDYVSGGTQSPTYNGIHLSKRGDLIVVTINYRLGILGFLNIPGITANAGIIDQQTALKWIKSNIDAFGGDPNNITIFGESAGASSVTTLTAMTGSKGLFNRVVAQSNPYYYASNGVRASDEFMAELGLSSDDLESLRKIPVQKLLDTQFKIYMKYSNVSNTHPWLPQIDGESLTQDPFAFFQEGKAEIELMIGSNLDENKLFSFMDPRSPNLDMVRVDKRVRRLMKLFGRDEDSANEFIDCYINERKESGHSNSPRDLYDNIATDLWFRILSIKLAESQYNHNKTSYMYLFTWESPYSHPQQGKLGSAHSLEIPFVFGSLDLPGMENWSGNDQYARNLSNTMMDCWINFARTGDPNHEGIPHWDKYNTDKRPTMEFGNKTNILNDPYPKTRLLWQNII